MKSELQHMQIDVVGGGVAGLATARAAAMCGANVRVFEQAPEIREVGAGLQLSPNGMRVIDALGLGVALRDTSLEGRGVVLRNQRGKQVLRMDLTGVDGTFLMAHRADLIAALSHDLADLGIELNLNARIEAGSARRTERALTVAADGARSGLRAALGGDAAPFFTGQVAWRAIIDAHPDEPAEAQVFMGAGRHLVSYPLKGGRRNIVAVQERSTWAADSWSTPDDPEALRAAFADFGGPVPEWLSQVEKVHIWGLFRRPVARKWYGSVNGASAVLVGDAAHPTLPFLAQGANLALEDAWCLPAALAQSLSVDQSGAGVQCGLQLFQDTRRARVMRAIEVANANARNYHIENKALQAVAHAVLRGGSVIAPSAAARKFNWLYGYDVTAAF
ncbi:FAD-dependent monooxygenase [Nereida ignava]|uniref:3-hydroxybenzoate 6-hydroxylase 1 n=1 Tax=Nereida ignava TaxID=282199 RepID=A0A0U1NH51_9RHOB|nr:FAD-dependent monooxygenase [Nereida ignava]CRK74062.1 3-hydroxybenzoate 6-hydroxylase 1 [Nereida ignava]SFJ29266.1 salicylate hydroxylase [Nereida ignava DSM 16309]